MVNYSKEDLFLVTGASSGIGKAIALSINEFGGKVIAVGRNGQALENVKKSSKNPEDFNIVIKDLSEDLDEISLWVKELVQEYGKISGFVHSAGVFSAMPMRVQNYEMAKSLFDINFFSGYFILKSLTDKRLKQEKLSSVFISSISSTKGEAGIGMYSATKGAINSMVKSSAKELAPYGVRVNSVLPGTVKTELLDKAANLYTENHIEELDSKYPLGLGKPEDISGIVCFLLSKESKWITGQNYIVDGGYI